MYIMSHIKNFYQILGSESKVFIKVIKKAKKIYAIMFHPDEKLGAQFF